MPKITKKQQDERVAEIRVAQLYARAAHAGQTRDDGTTAHAAHVIRVGYEVGRRKDMADLGTHFVVGAILHDVVEDTPVTIGMISDDFGQAVAAVVHALTDHFTPERYPKANRATRKSMEAARLSKEPLPIRIIKAIDRIDNLRDLHIETKSDAAFTRLYITESRNLLAALDQNKDLPDDLRIEFRAAIEAAVARVAGWKEKE
jgi:GTP pyrophosphokinase